MEGNRKLHRPAVSRDAKRYFRSLMTAVLTVTMVIGNMAASLSTAMAGQAIAKEEFRVHAEAIRAAAEKALKEGEPLTEPLAIGGKDKSLVKDYEKLLEANGTLYELDLFKDTETVKDVDGISLRVFMRLEEDDDPKSYALTGEEKLIFLYVNGSSETISARLNIDGYVSGFSTVRPYDAAFGNKEEEEAQSPGEGLAGTEEETPGTGETQGTPGGSGGSGSGSGGSSGGGSGSAGGAGTEEAASDPDKADVTENADTTEGGTAGTEQTEGEREEETKETSPEEADQTPAEKEGEAETEESAADESQSKKDDPTETREEAKNEENEGSGETEAPSEDKKEDTGNQAAAGTENKDSSEKDDGGKGGSQDDGGQKADAADNAGNAGDSGQADTGHESSGKDSEDTAKDSAQDDGRDSGKDSSVKDDSSDSKDGGAEKADDSKDSSAKDTGDSKDSGAKDAGDSKDSSVKDDSSKDSSDSKDSGSKDTGSEAKDSPDSKDAGEGKEQAQAIGISLHEITRVAKGQASDSDADDGNADSDYEEGGDPFDAEDAAKLAQEEQEKSFNRRGALSGKIYNLVSLEDSLTARAFQTSLSKMGMDAGELAEGSHILTYNVNPVGSAVLVRTPELVRDEAEVTFGVIPQVGYHIKDVTVNGESLEETGAESMASSSDAVKKALASSSDAGKGNEEFLEEDARFYTIPSVLEDQEVEIWLTEEVDGSHPEFRESKTVNGVTVTVSAEEGILPEGTYLSVEEVTDKVADAVKENVEAAEETTVTDVLAYDINLMLDGKKLSNAYWEQDYVTVEFSGERIEAINREAEMVEIAPLETPTKTVEAALGETEKVAVLDQITSEDIQVLDEVAGIRAEDVDSIRFQAEHFTVYIVYGANKEKKASFNFETDINIYMDDENGDVVIENKRYTEYMSATQLDLKIESNITTEESGEWTIKSYEISPDPLMNIQKIYYKTSAGNFKRVDHFLFRRSGTRYSKDGITETVVAVMDDGTEAPFSQVVWGISNSPDIPTNYSDNFFWIVEKPEEGQIIQWYVNGDLDKTTFAQDGEQPTYSNTGEIPARKITWVENNQTKEMNLEFVGWATEPNSKEFKQESELPPVTGNTQYYAVFTYKTLFYFVLSGKSNTSTQAIDYMFSGPDQKDGELVYGTVIVPDGFERNDRWYNENQFQELGKSIDDFIIQGPSEADKIKGIKKANSSYNEEWEYIIDWTTLSFAGSSVDYDYKVSTEDCILHVDGALMVNQDTKVTFLYTVVYPTGHPSGTVNQSTEHAKTEKAIPINSTVKEIQGGTITTDGYQYAQEVTYNGIAYHFDGWYVDAACTIPAEDQVDATEIQHFYARYYATDRLSYNPNGGSGVMSATEAEVYTDVTVKENGFTREGYQFVEWNTSADGTGTPYKAGDLYRLTAGTDILYAQWRAITGKFEIQKVLVNGKSFNELDGSQIHFQLYSADNNWQKGEAVGERKTVGNLTEDTKDEKNLVGSLVYSDIPLGNYWLYEELAAPGYQKLQNGIKIKIEQNNEGNICSSYFDEDGNTWKLIKEGNPMVVENHPAYTAVLPDTGGSGVGLIKEFGWMLLILAMMMAGAEVRYYGDRRRKERAKV